MATLKEIARKAGVSIRTVSRVIKNKPHISEKTAKRVQKVLDKFSYTPNLLARGLKAGRTNMLAVIASSLGQQVLTKKLACLLNTADNYGYKTLLGITDGDREKEECFVQEFAFSCDGFFFLSKPDNKNLRILEKVSKPFVFVDARSSRYPCVPIDRQAGVIEAIEKVKQHYKKYIFITPSSDKREPRRCGFEKAMADMQVRSEIINIPIGYFEDGYKAVERIGDFDKTLIVCYSDKLAVGLLKRLYELNIDIPAQAGVIGFDDDDYTEFTYKALSTISQSVTELADKSVDMLVKQISGKKFSKRCIVETKFVPRQTTIV